MTRCIPLKMDLLSRDRQDQIYGGSECRQERGVAVCSGNSHTGNCKSLYLDKFSWFIEPLHLFMCIHLDTWYRYFVALIAWNMTLHQRHFHWFFKPLNAVIFPNGWNRTDTLGIAYIWWLPTEEVMILWGWVTRGLYHVKILRDKWRTKILGN